MSIEILRSNALVDWLKSAGIDTEHARRVIIDAKAGEVVLVYVEQFGTDQMFKVEPPDLSKAEITVLRPNVVPK